MWSGLCKRSPVADHRNFKSNLVHIRYLFRKLSMSFEVTKHRGLFCGSHERLVVVLKYNFAGHLCGSHVRLAVAVKSNFHGPFGGSHERLVVVSETCLAGLCKRSMDQHGRLVDVLKYNFAGHLCESHVRLAVAVKSVFRRPLGGSQERRVVVSKTSLVVSASEAWTSMNGG